MAAKEKNPRAQSQELWLLHCPQPPSEIQPLSSASLCLDMKSPCNSTTHLLLGRDCQRFIPYPLSASSLLTNSNFFEAIMSSVKWLFPGYLCHSGDMQLSPGQWIFPCWVRHLRWYLKCGSNLRWNQKQLKGQRREGISLKNLFLIWSYFYSLLSLWIATSIIGNVPL